MRIRTRNVDRHGGQSSVCCFAGATSCSKCCEIDVSRTRNPFVGRVQLSVWFSLCRTVQKSSRRSDLRLAPHDSGVPFSGHKESHDDATAGNSRAAHPERFSLRTADWLHGNALANGSSAANWPQETTFRPIMTSAVCCWGGGVLKPPD